ncbi:MAG: radical SAM protein [Elusimicrobiota bacterium]
MKYNHIFGPVPSRRLGLSLGVDLVPHKTCSFDCIYCECGPTIQHTCKRGLYVDPDEVIEELRSFLSGSPELDYITFSGAGEPTLNSGIGKVVDFIKDNYSGYRLALLTNASLLSEKEVRDEIKRCDLIIPSVDAVSPDLFESINNPASGIDIREILKGIELLKKETAADIWVEIFVVPGMNDSEEELTVLKKALLKIQPDLVQLNTLDRPGVIASIFPVDKKGLERIREFLNPLPVGIVGIPDDIACSGPVSHEGIEDRILALIGRRPCTVDDLSAALGLKKMHLLKYLRRFEKCDRIIPEKKERGVFYILKKDGR